MTIVYILQISHAHKVIGKIILYKLNLKIIITKWHLWKNKKIV